jgi:hypothetical protein
MRRRRLDLDRSGPWIAVAGLFIVLWCTVTTWLFAPWWGVVLAFGLLIPQALLVKAWARTRPRLSMVVPVVGLFLWFALSYVGATSWDWNP